MEPAPNTGNSFHCHRAIPSRNSKFLHSLQEHHIPSSSSKFPPRAANFPIPSRNSKFPHSIQEQQIPFRSSKFPHSLLEQQILSRSSKFPHSPQEHQIPCRNSKFPHYLQEQKIPSSPPEQKIPPFPPGPANSSRSSKLPHIPSALWVMQRSLHVLVPKTKPKQLPDPVSPHPVIQTKVSSRLFSQAVPLAAIISELLDLLTLHLKAKVRVDFFCLLCNWSVQSQIDVFHQPLQEWKVNKSISWLSYPQWNSSCCQLGRGCISKNLEDKDLLITTCHSIPYLCEQLSSAMSIILIYNKLFKINLQLMFAPWGTFHNDGRWILPPSETDLPAPLSGFGFPPLQFCSYNTPERGNPTFTFRCF